MPRRRREPDL